MSGLWCASLGFGENELISISQTNEKTYIIIHLLEKLVGNNKII